MLLDKALDILDYVSFQLVNDEPQTLNKTDLIMQLDALEQIKISSQDQMMESNELSKEELINEIERLNSVLRSRRDMLQMIICAVDHWNRR
jgi:hypothetical protein